MVDKRVEHDFRLMSVVAVVALFAMIFLISPANSGVASITGNVVGAAITENSQSCADSDTGLDYASKGRLTGNLPRGFYNEDRCFMKYFLREVYCKDNRAASHITICSSGCENGMCKEKNDVEKRCGDGILTGWERCDGTNLGDKTCESLGYIGGTLSCTRHCVMNTSGCIRPVCGNDIKEIGEVCDGTDLNNKSCRNFGLLGGGTLKCVACKFDTTGCIKACSSDAQCGERICVEGKVHETCERGRCVLKATCTPVITVTTKCAKEGEYTSGTVEPRYQFGCCAGLREFDQYSQVDMRYRPIGGGNLCYNPEKGTPVCKNQGTRSEGWYYSKTGTLLKYGACVKNATITTRCTDSDGGKNYNVKGTIEGPKLTTGEKPVDYCVSYSEGGNTLVEYQCLNGGLSSESYVCPYGCKDGACVEQRINISFCGDGRISPGEECDGTLLNGMICTTLGFDYGELKCTNCKYDTTKCYRALPCNDTFPCLQPAPAPEWYRECNDNAACRVGGGFVCENNKCILHKRYYDCLNCTYGCSQVSAGNTVCLLAPNYCGNSVIDAGEDCDGSALGNETCLSQGFVGGTLRCNRTTCKFDRRGCSSYECTTYTDCPQPVTIPEYQECNGNSLCRVTGGYDCVSNKCILNKKYFDCTPCPDGCRNGTCVPASECSMASDCKVNACGVNSCVKKDSIIAACVLPSESVADYCTCDNGKCTGHKETMPRCGDGIINPQSEQCDNSNLGQLGVCPPGSAPSSASITNPVRCRDDCTLDYSGCYPIIDHCGNGVIDPDEGCEPNYPDGQTCTSLGYLGGTLRCTSGCLLDTTGCIEHRTSCGDGIVSKPNDDGFTEQCDTVVVGMGCPPQYYGGSVLCTNCLYDYSNCSTTPPPRCGDGSINQLSEECDGNLLGASCESLGYTGGYLSCTNCKYDKTHCVTETPPRCGDNIVQSPNSNGVNEQCDGSVPSGISCEQYGYAYGEMMCVNCELNSGTCSACNNNGVCQPRMSETVENCAGDCVFVTDYLSLYFNPQSIDVAVGDTVNFDINVGSMSNLYGYQFDINYNPAVLEFISLTDGGFLSTSPFCVEYNATSGLIRNVACTRMGTSGVSGSGTLKRVSFRALASGRNSIWLSNVKVVGVSGTTLPEIIPEVIGADVSVS